MQEMLSTDFLSFLNEGRVEVVMTEDLSRLGVRGEKPLR